MLLRHKMRQIKGGCADCGAPEPSWASINRGILICDDCCSVHRSLGRHISQVKSLRRGFWNAQQLKMVQNLADSSANNIWEHSLLDPSHGKLGRRKPAPTDPVHPNKAKFIRDKHQMLAFVYRPGKDDRQLAEGDTSLQLHSSCRTPNTETSLRLLSLGANPNYWHPERGTGPLHVAARAGQALQAELLMVYGADPSRPDRAGLTPIQHAREAGHSELCRRLEECQYELTDRLAYFLTGRRPDHAAGQHFVVPPPVGPDTEALVTARLKLRNRQSRLLAELAADVCNSLPLPVSPQLQSRLLAADLQSRLLAADVCNSFPLSVSPQLQSRLLAADVCNSLPLPVSPQLQSRLLAADLQSRLLAELAADVYDEVDRRETDAHWLAQHPAATSGPGSVPFLPVNPEFSSTRNQGRQKLARFTAPEFRALIVDVLQEARRRQLGPAAAAAAAAALAEGDDDEPLYDSVASEDDYAPIEQLQRRENAQRMLAEQNELLRPTRTESPENGDSGERTKDSSLNSLEANHHRRASDGSSGDDRLMRESSLAPPESNEEMRREIDLLRDMVQRLTSENTALRASCAGAAAGAGAGAGPPPLPPHAAAGRRPVSMFETRERPAQPPTWCLERKLSEGDRVSPPGSTAASLTASGSCSLPHQSVPQRASGSRSLPLPGASEPPKQEVVIRKTELVTRRIQRLLTAAQHGRTDQYNACIDRIYSAVLEMVSVFPQSGCDERALDSVQQLSTSAWRLQNESAGLLAAAGAPSAHDARLITQQVIQMAFEVAKGAKQLVMIYQ
ncbi:ARF GTPase-activating protein GIT2 [Amphibalanus amphitrite]|uniref:ARF GTPase-activating protein GIT2 n=1 Tax=Amphibalanus amphitrite TaxID=1232801 RepID=A0A6A4VYH8_AMPAM|nr:ARF GTPase-activating protein GIT2 [Amphibalanus amphitrite]